MSATNSLQDLIVGQIAIGSETQGWASLLDSLVSGGIDSSVLAAFPVAINSGVGAIVALDGAGFIDYPTTNNTLADIGGNIYYSNGNALADSAAQLYYGGNEILADASGNLYYSDNSILADGSGNLYFGNGSMVPGIVIDSGWTANASAGSKTVAVQNFAASGFNGTMTTALNTVSAGSGTFFAAQAQQVQDLTNKLQAIEFALAALLLPNA